MIPFATFEHPRVLVVALSGIGNLLMASPVWTRLKAANPRAEISVLVAARGTADVLERNPTITTIFRGSPKPSFQEWLGMVRHTQRGRFDIGIVTFPGQRITSSSMLFFGGVKITIGHRYVLGPWQRSGLLLTHAIPEIQPLHDVAQNLRLLEPLGVPTNPAEARYAFPLGPEDHRAAEEFLVKHDLLGNTLIGFHPGAYTDLSYKRWPVERWQELGNRLAETHAATILLFGGPDERALKATIWKGIHNHRALEVELPLRATAAVIRRCAFFVSNDSGLMHVAVSQDVETFGLFGPTDERRTAPWGPRGHVIRAPGTHPTYDVAQLADVRKREDTDPSLLALTVEEIFARIDATVHSAGSRVASSASAVS